MWLRRLLVLLGAFHFHTQSCSLLHSFVFNQKKRSNNPQKSLAANFYELLIESEFVTLCSRAGQRLSAGTGAVTSISLPDTG